MNNYSTYEKNLYKPNSTWTIPNCQCAEKIRTLQKQKENLLRTLERVQKWIKQYPG